MFLLICISSNIRMPRRSFRGNWESFSFKPVSKALSKPNSGRIARIFRLSVEIDGSGKYLFSRNILYAFVDLHRISSASSVHSVEYLFPYFDLTLALLRV